MIVLIDTCVTGNTRRVRCYDDVAIVAEFSTTSHDGRTDNGLRRLAGRMLAGVDTVSETAEVVRL